MLTPPQLAALAAWANITPETHRHLCVFHNRINDDRYHQVIDPERLPDPTDPAADPQVVDRVWLADVMWTLSSTTKNLRVHGFKTDFVALIESVDYKTSVQKSATLALLLAARAAGVLEVVEIMGGQS